MFATRAETVRANRMLAAERRSKGEERTGAVLAVAEVGIVKTVSAVAIAKVGLFVGVPGEEVNGKLVMVALFLEAIHVGHKFVLVC